MMMKIQIMNNNIIREKYKLILYLFLYNINMFSNFARNNISLVSIIIFVILFIVLIMSKPALIFDKNGKFREFGLGYRNKTIVPIWLAIIIFGIISYLSVIYFVNFNRFIFQI